MNLSKNNPRNQSALGLRMTYNFLVKAFTNLTFHFKKWPYPVSIKRKYWGLLSSIDIAAFDKGIISMWRKAYEKKEIPQTLLKNAFRVWVPFKKKPSSTGTGKLDSNLPVPSKITRKGVVKVIKKKCPILRQLLLDTFAHYKIKIKNKRF